VTDVRTDVMPRSGEFLIEARRCYFGLLSNGMIFGVGVRRVGSDDVTDPTERAAGANPETRRNN